MLPLPEVETLVLSGGGPKMGMHLGWLKGMVPTGPVIEAFPNLKRIHGTSSGSITAVAILAGMTADEMISVYMKRLQFERHDFRQIVKKCGVFSSDLVAGVVKGVTTKTMGEFCNRGIDLVINAVNLTTGDSVLFDNINTPNIPVYKVVQMTCAIPLVLDSVEHNGDCYVDGGIVCNFNVHGTVGKTLGLASEVTIRCGMRYDQLCWERYMVSVLMAIHKTVNKIPTPLADHEYVVFDHTVDDNEFIQPHQDYVAYGLALAKQ